MKITLTILLLASLGVMGQSKIKTDGISCPKCEITTLSNINNRYVVAALQQSSIIWTSFGMKWKPVPNLEKTDSIYIYVKKSQLRWVNDSTAIIRKP